MKVMRLPRLWGKLPLISLASSLFLPSLLFSQISVWYPEGVKTVRGAMVDFSDKVSAGETKTAPSNWADAARIWKFALIDVGRDVKSADIPAQLKALGDKTGHPELAHIPWVTHGMSWSSGRSYGLAKDFPERTIAAGIVCISIGETPASADAQLLKTPMVFIAGEGDYVETTISPAFRARPLGAQWCAVIQWGQFHSFANSPQFLKPFYDQCIRLRLPKDQSPLDGPVKLRNLKEEEGWLGFRDLQWKSKRPAILPYAVHAGSHSNSIWFPNEFIARLWRSFHAKGPEASILNPSPANKYPPSVDYGSNVQILANYSGPPAKSVAVYDGDALLKSFPSGPFILTTTQLSPGYHAINAVASRVDGEAISNLGVTGIRNTANVDVALTHPAPGERIVKGASVSLAASALSGEGAIASVEFFVDGVSIGKDNTTPYSAPWTAAAEGIFHFGAAAYNAKGEAVHAYPIKVAVISPPVAASVQVVPALGWIKPGGKQAFTAVVRDQYGYPIRPQPTVSWSVAGGGAMDAAGSFTAGAEPGGPFIVTATAGAAKGTALVQASHTVRINFGPSFTETPDGFIADKGQAYGAGDNGMAYGWMKGKPQEANVPRANIYHRGYGDSIGVERATFISMHSQFEPPYNKKYQDYTWEIEVPNGEYTVRIVMGDKENLNLILPGTLPRVEPDSHSYKVNVEQVTVVDGKPTRSAPWVEGKKDVNVTDGKLTVSNAPGQHWNKICFIEFAPKGQFATAPVTSSLSTASGTFLRPALPRVLPGRLVFELAGGRGTTLTLGDLSGRTVWSRRLRGRGSYTLDTSPFPSGKYVVRVEANDHSLTRGVWLE